MGESAIWLMLVCVSYPGYPCYLGGTATTIMVREKQCKAALALRDNRLNIICIAPDGTTLTNTKP